MLEMDYETETGLVNTEVQMQAESGHLPCLYPACHMSKGMWQSHELTEKRNKEANPDITWSRAVKARSKGLHKGQADRAKEITPTQADGVLQGFLEHLTAMFTAASAEQIQDKTAGMMLMTNPGSKAMENSGMYKH